MEDDVLLLITQINCSITKVAEYRRRVSGREFLSNYIKRVKKGLFKSGEEKRKENLIAQKNYNLQTISNFDFEPYGEKN